MIIIVRLAGEIGIKSPRSRKNFEHALINNIKNVINVEEVNIDQGYIILNVKGDFSKLNKVFGIASFSPADVISFSKLQDIVDFVKNKYAERVKGKKFAIRVKRVGKHNFTSLDAAKVIGSSIYPYSSGVDLENPEIEIHVDIRQDYAYVYDKVYEGAKGLPIGTTGRTIVLFSGGFDSPIATWMMMKRGSSVTLLNFKLGGELHKKIVLDEVKILSEWNSGHKIKVYFIDGIKVLSALAGVKKYIRVVVLKRIMYRTAELLAKKINAYSVTTGESLSQVSSQTMKNLFVTEFGINIPIFRPLIGFDKEEIIELARKVGTYEYSSKLPEYCAISSKSTTGANLEEVLESEKQVNTEYEKLIEEAEVVEV
ncbi:tRNA 4-thiouridine(8) synthase ThiI [Sulfolobus sp. S-194]|uniref:tRNA uracil 4-sulfurtransferase ThiI n=1 Tax=Sulfolobus sp. S-194 TaxID=2512240 RepID=UPI001436F97C|nr:tRNA uracil 4-sulfurtransferase ThiI [Sulfolobus sp. S-194]QIW25011.1 tRNA 4-thiouridine(8) synthase ThiI [Sulfolobus sp. S-194]